MEKWKNENRNILEQREQKDPLAPPVIPLWGTEGGQERIFPPSHSPPRGEKGEEIENKSNGK